MLLHDPSGVPDQVQLSGLAAVLAPVVLGVGIHVGQQDFVDAQALGSRREQTTPLCFRLREQPAVLRPALPGAVLAQIVVAPVQPDCRLAVRSLLAR